jgi:hypothetical protein
MTKNYLSSYSREMVLPEQEGQFESLERSVEHSCRSRGASPGQLRYSSYGSPIKNTHYDKCVNTAEYKERLREQERKDKELRIL